jgi:nucleotide-binding universal stress UspA family protein
MFNKIMVCIDGSDHSIRAIHTAAEIAAKFGAEAVAANVLEEAAEIAPYVMAMEAAPDMTALFEQAELEQSNELKCAETLFAKAGVACKPLAIKGNVVESILKAAEDEHADLIVIGSRGLGGFKRLLLGSTSDAVSHHAHCPVLIVR